jgi:hypothetical protein
VAQALAGFGARPWQVELTAAPVAQALNEGDRNAADGEARAAAHQDTDAAEAEGPPSRA